MARGEFIMEAIEHGPQMLQEAGHAVHALHPHQDANGQWMLGDQKLPSLHVSKAEVATTALLDDAQKQAAKANRAAQEEERAKQVEAENSINVAGKKVDAETAYTGLEMVSQFAGAPGMAVSTGFAAMGGAAAGAKKLDKLTDFYRDTVASALQIQPELVDEKALKQFANMRALVGDKTIQEAIEAADGEAAKGFARAGTGLTGFFAGAAAGSAILPGIGSFVGGGIGAIAGEQAISSFFGKDEMQTANGQIEALAEKYNAGETVSAGDVFAVRMHQYKRLEALVDEKTSQMGLKDFTKLDDMDRARVMQEFQDVLPQVIAEADLLNKGAVTPDQLAQASDLRTLVQPMQQVANVNAAPTQGAWAQRVGGQRPQAASYAEQVRAQQAAVAMQQQQL